MSEIDTNHVWWSRLRHQGMLLSPVVMLERFPQAPEQPPFPKPQKLRDAHTKFLARLADLGPDADRDENAVLAWVDALLEGYVGHDGRLGKKNSVPEKFTAVLRIGSRSETIRPHRVVFADAACTVPAVLVMADPSPHVGRGRGRNAYARFLELLRGTGHRLGLLTNGQQFRLVYAGLDFESWVEWESERWFDDGDGSQELAGLRQLLSPESLSPVREKVSGLLDAVEESRKRQADLSSVLRENVRQAVELLLEEVSAKHRTDARIFELLYTKASAEKLTDAEAHEALMQSAVRIVMRMVVCLFAESRRLLPVNDPIYAGSYGVRTLYELLDEAVRNEGGLHTLHNRQTAWPRLMALFRLVHAGSPHGSFPLRAYGGALFRPGKPGDPDPVSRALDILERHVPVSDATIFAVLRKLLRGPLPVVRGRTRTFVEGPVDYTDLRTEFIGLIYEGLLDYRVKRTDEKTGPQVFLNLGREPVLPLARLEEMLRDDPRGLKDLLTTLRKEKVTASAASEESEEEAENEDAEDTEAEPEEAEAVVEEPAIDQELLPRSAQDAQDDAVAWAKQAIVVAGLVRRQNRREPDTEYQNYIESEAKKLIHRVVSVGEFYLVRAGNTRKGTGTFYTRPQLAVPTVHRTLEPLCYDKQTDGTLVPKTPDVILGLKVCDPACGSASFLVAALHYLTEALYRSLCHHSDLDDPARSTKVTLPFGKPRTGKPGEEYLPFPPNDPQHGDRFADRVKALLRRHVVERCIYGVDINPLAVEFARVSLWVETLDPDLPFSFLDHKIKVGNALVGCWLDRVLDYPLKAWEREGGDGKDGPRTDRIETMLKGPKGPNGRRSGDGIIKQEVRRLIEQNFQGQVPLFADQTATVDQVVAAARMEYELLHQMAMHDPDERERFYRERIENSRPLKNLKRALDEWCAIWFWPADEESMRHVPTPLSFHRSTPEREEIVERVCGEMKFFHWEVAFPDVFNAERAGFDAMLGNPPWDVMKPNSHEFFSEYDPLYRTYDKQTALRRQEELSDTVAGLNEVWDNYNASFKSLSGWVRSVGGPFDLALARGRAGDELAGAWAKAREKRRGGRPSLRPFQSQGGADLNSYKLFLELAYRLLSSTGRMGFIVPSGLYTDSGTKELRELFLDHATWNWLFSFENKKRIFAIHGSFKFAPVILDRRRTDAPMRAAFMVHDLADWERADPPTFDFDRSLISLFSPRSKSLPEVRTQDALAVCETIYQHSVRVGDPDSEWSLEFAREFDMSTDSRLFPPLSRWEDRGYKADSFGRWVGPQGDFALPFFQGVMIHQFDGCYKGWQTGLGRSAVWQQLPYEDKQYKPKYLISEADFRQRQPLGGLPKFGYRRIARTTDTRTFIGSSLQDAPCGDSIFLLEAKDRRSLDHLVLSAICNSLTFDFVVRQRLGGTNLSWFIVNEFPLPMQLEVQRGLLILQSARLTHLHRRYAPDWLSIKSHLSLCGSRQWKEWWAVTEADRLVARCQIESLCADAYGLNSEAFEVVVQPDPSNSTGFWRVDKRLAYRERLTGLAAAAFRALKEGKWSAKSAATLSNDEFFDIIGIPEMTSQKAAEAKGLAGPLIRKRPGCHTWEPEKFTKDDPRYGWTWDHCWQDAVALLGSEQAVKDYIEGKPQAEAVPTENANGPKGKPFPLRGDDTQGRLF